MLLTARHNLQRPTAIRRASGLQDTVCSRALLSQALSPRRIAVACDDDATR